MLKNTYDFRILLLHFSFNGLITFSILFTVKTNTTLVFLFNLLLMDPDTIYKYKDLFNDLCLYSLRYLDHSDSHIFLLKYF